MKKIFLLSLALVAVTGIAMADHADVVAADKLLIENYTIPSYIPMWVAREAARKDPSTENLAALKQAVEDLKSKYEPYCVVATINGDPQTNMGFCWMTNEGVEDGKVELTDTLGNVTTIDATPKTTKSLRYAVPTSGIIKATGMSATQKYKYTNHKALATGLTPGMKYTYRVGYKDHWSETFSFTTAAKKQGAFSFLYMTDSHLQSRGYVDATHRCALAALNNEDSVSFCVFPGDFVETGTGGNSEWEWERWFEEAMKPLILHMPIVPTDGNHDDSQNLNYNWHFNTDASFNKRSLMVKPQFNGIVYSFVYGDVLFLVYSMQDYWRQSGEEECIKAMHSDYLKTDIGNWFREQVEAHPECKYRVTLCHKNVFSGSGHQEDKETPLFRAMMLPIFADCQIDLALQGHDHCYEVIGPVDPWKRTVVEGSITDTVHVAVEGSKNRSGIEGGTYCVDDGTLYFIGATCGNKRYDPYSRAQMEAQKNITRVENYFDLFQGKFGQPGSPSYTRINVSEENIELKTYAVDKEGNTSEYNTFHVVRTKEHTPPTGFHYPQSTILAPQGVYDLMGNRYDKIQGSGMYIVVNKEGTKKIHVQ